MSAHTPGPWREAGNHVRAPETAERLELDVLVRGGNRDDIRANVRLIAAAPDLLDALCEARILLELNGIDINDTSDYGSGRADGIINRISAAIDKADGRKPC